ncbi:sensor histidine kinase N-terminal domain-containing protein [Azospirillum doebereinerae]|uniref:sensor histidine kinase N-terminal domain-containing protein n=1 Tax=Azospirillum doebereinerae TaxID=92933 RepID=UPI003850350E
MWPTSARPIEGYSLRRRLFVRLFGVLAALTGGLFLFVDAYAQRAADAAFDRLLLASALAIADTVRVQDGRVLVDLPYSSLSILAQGGRDRLFYRITAPDGTPITGYDDLPVTGKAGGQGGSGGGSGGGAGERCPASGTPSTGTSPSASPRSAVSWRNRVRPAG